MALTDNIITQFVKATKDDTKVSKETTVYGEVVIYNGLTYVKIDGSDQLTPVSATIDAKDGDRVMVLLKDHQATVTGSTSSPAARLETVKELDGTVTQVGHLISHKLETEEITAIKGTIDSLKTKIADIENADIVKAYIETLEAKYADLEYVSANDVEAINAIIENLKVEIGKFGDISTENLEAINADIGQLTAYNAEFTYVSAATLSAIKADIKQLDADKVSAEDLEAKYANIDFSNIGEAAIEHFYATSGLIKDVVVGDGVITGELVGVTIKGDLIEGGTIVADKLVIKGEDGIYYKLNTEGGAVPDEGITKEKLQNGLSGSVILANTITAEKINVHDLVAFDATIGGFNITDDSIYSGVKETVTNTTRGIYLDNTGQVAFGDSSNYLRYYKDKNNVWKLEIAAGVISLGGGSKSVEDTINDMQKEMETIKDEVTTNLRIEAYYRFYLLQSSTASAPSKPTAKPTELTSKTNWDDAEPTYTEGSTNSLYFVDCTVFNDDTFKYSEVSLSSAYESAKIAYNKAVNAQSTANSANNKIDGLEIGGRNLIVQATLTDGYRLDASGLDYASVYCSVTETIDVQPDEEMIFTCYAVYADEGDTYFQVAFYTADGTFISRPIMNVGNTTEAKTSWTTVVPSNAAYARAAFPMALENKVKLEYGNRATDWSPSPEDGDIASSNAQDTANDANDKADQTKEDLENTKQDVTELTDNLAAAKLEIDTLRGIISSLVVDENGNTLMTEQEGGSYTFNMGDYQKILDDYKEQFGSLSELLGDMSELSSADTATTLMNIINQLREKVKDYEPLTEHVKIDTYTDPETGTTKPCIELYEDDSTFKLRITNTDIQFADGTVVPAWISNKKLYIKEAEVTEELQQGGFVWKIRDNGNLGLMWRGDE